MKYITLFLMSVWLICQTQVTASPSIDTIHVRDYGAIPDDGADDTIAIRSAFQAANTSGAVIQFDRGEYNVSGQDPDGQGNYKEIFSLYGYHHLVIEGNGALLNARNWATVFNVDNVTDLTVRNLKIDWEKDLPFTSGEIVATGLENVSGKEYAYIDVAVVAPHTARSGLGAEAFLQYDPEAQHPSIRGYDIYNSDGFDVPCAVPRAGILRCYKSDSHSVTPVGTYVIVRHQTYSYNTFSVYQSSHVSFEEITIYASPGVGIYAVATDNIELSQVSVRIRPGSGRWLSSSADATHFDNVRGTLTVTNSFFEGMGDDALNVHTNYLRVISLTSPQTFHLELARTGDLPIGKHPHVGDTLQVGVFPNPLQHIALLTVSGVVDNGDNTIDVSVAETIPPTVGSGALVANRSGLPDFTTIQNCEVQRNRARGLLIQSHNVLIENCQFEDISGPAILMSSDADYFFEGIPAHNVTIRNNRLHNNNYGAAREGGTITIMGVVEGEVAGAATFSDILIEDNDFRNSDGHAAVFVASADAISIRNNSISHNIIDPIYVHSNNTCNILIDDVPVCANYQSEFQGSVPSTSWQYLWNATGPIGQLDNYTSLLWNGSQYDSDGVSGLPDSGSMAFGHLREAGGHAGQATSQSGTDPRYAIAAYTISSSDSYEIRNSFISSRNPGCSTLDDGIELRVYVNDNLVVTHVIASGETIDFDTFLGELDTGDIVSLAVGPNDWDDCDAFDWDFTIALVTRSSGEYSGDFQANKPPPRWQYLWNAGGSIGEASHYTSLFWNGTMYDADGDPDYPDSDTDLSYGQLSRYGGHPGPSVDQGQSVDRYVIAAFTILRETEYAIKDSMITVLATNCGDGNILLIFINDAFHSSRDIDNGTTVDFDQDLGVLQAGDVVYFAVGPNTNDSCDYFSWDFTVAPLPPKLDETVYFPIVARLSNTAVHRKDMK